MALSQPPLFPRQMIQFATLKVQVMGIPIQYIGVWDMANGPEHIYISPCFTYFWPPLPPTTNFLVHTLARTLARMNLTVYPGRRVLSGTAKKHRSQYFHVYFRIKAWYIYRQDRRAARYEYRSQPACRLQMDACSARSTPLAET